MSDVAFSCNVLFQNFEQRMCVSDALITSHKNPGPIVTECDRPCRHPQFAVCKLHTPYTVIGHPLLGHALIRADSEPRMTAHLAPVEPWRTSPQGDPS